MGLSEPLRRINDLSERRLSIWRSYMAVGGDTAKERTSRVQRIKVQLDAAWDSRRRELFDAYIVMYEPGIEIRSSLHALLVRSEE